MIKRLLRIRAFTRLPGLMRLSYLLLRDPRVSPASKALVLGTVGFILSPLDLPNWIPIVGQGLDIIFIAAILDRFIGAAPPHVVREHRAALGWSGE